MLLILPIVISLLIKKYTPKGFEVVKRLQPVSFYLWAVCMMVLIGSTIHTIMIHENPTETEEDIAPLGMEELGEIAEGDGSDVEMPNDSEPTGAPPTETEPEPIEGFDF